jgi:hypothetical protein
MLESRGRRPLDLEHGGKERRRGCTCERNVNMKALSVR